MTRGNGESRPRKFRKERQSGNGRRVWGYVPVFLLGAGIAATLLCLFFSGGTNCREVQGVYEPRSLARLLGQCPDELQGVDIAEMNLLCAAGLPGAEDLDVDRCLATLDSWAARVRRETEASSVSCPRPAVRRALPELRGLLPGLDASSGPPRGLCRSLQ